jgi:hypothetical protein
MVLLLLASNAEAADQSRSDVDVPDQQEMDPWANDVPPESGWAEPAFWSTVGSAGMIDEGDTAEYKTSMGQLGVRPTLSTATVVARYPIFDPALSGPPSSGYLSCHVLRARYNDNGDQATVYSRIVRWGIQGGYETVADLSSNDFPGSGWQTNEEVFSHDFDFVENTYFLEAWVHKLGTNGTPELGIVQIEAGECSQ